MGLDRGDVDLGSLILLIRGTKFGKCRLVPLHSSTAEHLAAYQARRDELCPHPSTSPPTRRGATNCVRIHPPRRSSSPAPAPA
ncbi:hypothetical protein ACQP2T_13855 [Nonomuraea sp. CA-143628]|uniref:hypothetical protein n=1 Tax=Nonomuraea sp. CA-143628 TaxID=3239997 RepID=UPI003D90F338